MKTKAQTTAAQAFRASRILAEGWNAARANALDTRPAAPNPYPPGPEHARWNEGFTQARAR